MVDLNAKAKAMVSSYLCNIYVTQHSKIRNKSGLPKLANPLQSARMGIFGWKGRFSDIGEFSYCSYRRLLLCCCNIIKRVITLLKRDIWNSYVDLSEHEEQKMCFIQMHRVHLNVLPTPAILVSF